MLSYSDNLNCTQIYENISLFLFLSIQLLLALLNLPDHLLDVFGVFLLTASLREDILRVYLWVGGLPFQLDNLPRTKFSIYDA